MRYGQALLLVALAAAPVIHAETLYVIEQLVVSVNSAPDASSGERVGTIKSGEAVEVLDRQGDQIHVHLSNGTEGWVRKSYLSADEPLQHRLTERTAEVEKLKQDVARLQGDLAVARAGSSAGRQGPTQNNTAAASAPRASVNAIAPAAAQANATAATKVPSAPPAATAASGATDTSPAGGETNTVSTAVDPAAGEPAYFMTPPESPAHPVWHWAVGSFVVALGLGYALGWYMLDRRIRRKYGGLRIY